MTASSKKKPFEYKDADHSYWDQERRIYGLSEILRGVGAIQTLFFSSGESILERGELLHLATRLDDTGDLDPESVDVSIQPYLDDYRIWRALAKPRWIGIETPQWCEPLHYACTPDRWGMLQGLSRVAVVDIKTGYEYEWHPLQTAMQVMAIESPGYGYAKYQRFSLYLRGDGKPRLVEHKEVWDYQVAQSMVHTYRWLVERGLRTPEPLEEPHD